MGGTTLGHWGAKGTKIERLAKHDWIGGAGPARQAAGERLVSEQGHLPLTTHHLPLTTYHLPLTCHSPLTIVHLTT